MPWLRKAFNQLSSKSPIMWKALKSTKRKLLVFVLTLTKFKQELRLALKKKILPTSEDDSFEFDFSYWDTKFHTPIISQATPQPPLMNHSQYYKRNFLKIDLRISKWNYLRISSLATGYQTIFNFHISVAKLMLSSGPTWWILKGPETDEYSTIRDSEKLSLTAVATIENTGAVILRVLSIHFTKQDAKVITSFCAIANNTTFL